MEDSLFLMSSAFFLHPGSARLRGKTSLDNRGNSKEYPSYLELEKKGTLSVRAEEFLKFVAENLSKATYINIINQYQPEYKALEYPEIARRIKRSEYAEALKWAKKYGLTRLAR